MKHVLLIGFMGAGKSTVGRIVAQRLGRPYVDLDELIESREGRTIREIFDTDGEAEFRKMETRALGSLGEREPSVIACGGGVVIADENRVVLSRLGTVVYLVVSAGEMTARVGSDPDRPLLRRGALSASQLLASRESLYAAVADIRVDTVGRTAEQVADLVLEELEGRHSAGAPVRIPVHTASGHYEVIVGEGLLDEAGALLAEVSDASRVAMLCDDTVADLYGARASAQIARGGFDTHPLSFPAGESSKSWPVAGEVLESYAQAGLDRTDLVVACGGGVVGDLAGFTAATYLRGVSFAQIPTTLLAQVDSSVGGKTGVDLRAGKNLAGAFKQPVVVIADTALLSSLPEVEWRSGLAEVAKSAVIDSGEFLGWMERHSDALVGREPAVVAEAVRRCVAFKAGVVSEDERESGMRECLNYGHTLGHALESVAGYGVIPHGVAVAEGMRFAARLAVEIAGASAEFVRRQDALLDALGLPFLDGAYDTGMLLDAMHSDKKARGGRVRFVLASAPGRWECITVEDARIADHLRAWSGLKQRHESGSGEQEGDDTP